MYRDHHVKYQSFSSDFTQNWIFSTDFRKIHIKFHKISRKSTQWEHSCYMRADRHDEADSRFSQYCECALKFHIFHSECAYVFCKNSHNILRLFHCTELIDQTL